MKWRNRRASRNVEDRRGTRRVSGRAAGGGGIMTIVLVVGAMYFGIDPRVVLQMTGGGGSEQTASYTPTAAENKLAGFVGVVLADTEDVWNTLFRQRGQRYQEPKLVMFTGAVQSGCGSASAAMGPFYCPADNKVYIDLAFYQDLRNRHNAPGDFAQAYVIAHEVAHHIQNLTGVSDQVHKAQQRASKADANVLSVKLELQADCLAGVWANHTQRAKQVLEQGDVEEALTAASAIGDDRLQKQATGQVRPESFTHGSAKQRVRWFSLGMETGDMDKCDTFNARRL